MRRHSLRLQRLLRRWGQTRPSLRSATSHYASEEIAWAMSDVGGWIGRRLMRTDVGLAPTASLQLVAETAKLFLVSGRY